MIPPEELAWIFEDLPSAEDLNLPIADDRATQNWLRNEVADTDLDYQKLRRRAIGAYESRKIRLVVGSAIGVLGLLIIFLSIYLRLVKHA